MATFNKFNQFKEELAKKAHNLDTDTLKVMLTNVAPVATNSVKADLTEISVENGYTAGGTAIANQDAEQTGGTLSLSGDDVVFTAIGGSIGPLRYAVLYNDTHPSDGLIGWWDYGSELTLLDSQSLTIVFGATILTLS